MFTYLLSLVSHPVVFLSGLILGALFGFYGPKLVAPGTVLGKLFGRAPKITA